MRRGVSYIAYVDKSSWTSRRGIGEVKGEGGEVGM